MDRTRKDWVTTIGFSDFVGNFKATWLVNGENDDLDRQKLANDLVMEQVEVDGIETIFFDTNPQKRSILPFISHFGMQYQDKVSMFFYQWMEDKVSKIR